MLRNHGQNPDEKEPDFLLPGFNYRMTEFQAALGKTQLVKINRIIAARRLIAARYASLLSNLEVQPPIMSSGSEPVLQSYVVLLPQSLASKRSVLIKDLRDRGIETTIGTYHVPLTTYYRKRYNYQVGDFPVTDAVFNRALTLPLYEGMSEQQQDEVVQQLRECISSLA